MSAACNTDVPLLLATAPWWLDDEQPHPTNPNAIPNATGLIVRIMFLLLVRENPRSLGSSGTPHRVSRRPERVRIVSPTPAHWQLPCPALGLSRPADAR
jgi:hypothetical protein